MSNRSSENRDIEWHSCLSSEEGQSCSSSAGRREKQSGWSGQRRCSRAIGRRNVSAGRTWACSRDGWRQREVEQERDGAGPGIATSWLSGGCGAVGFWFLRTSVSSSGCQTSMMSTTRGDPPSCQTCGWSCALSAEGDLHGLPANTPMPPLGGVVAEREKQSCSALVQRLDSCCPAGMQ